MLGKNEKLMVRVILINFASRQIQTGEAKYQKQLLDMYKLRDDEETFLSNKRIADITFENVIVTAAACGDFKWATYFRRKYKPYLDEETKENALSLSQAYLHFHKGGFEKATDVLLKVESVNLEYELRFRSLSIRAFYESALRNDDDMEFILAKAKAFKSFIATKDVEEDKKEAYMNFCTICMNLISGRRKATMRKKMKEMEHLKFRVWLLEKVNAVR